MNTITKPKGYVYIIQAEDGPVKIGISIHPRKRLAEISAASGRTFIRIYVSHELENPRAIEQYLHFHFREQRLTGEWFDLPFDLAVKSAENLITPTAFLEGEQTQTYLRGRSLRSRLPALKDGDVINMDRVDGFLSALDDEDLRAMNLSLCAEIEALNCWAVDVAEILSEHGMDGIAIMEGAMRKCIPALKDNSQTSDNQLSFECASALPSKHGVTIE